MLTPIPGQEFPSPGSKKFINFDCSCGRKNIQKRWCYFTKGKTSSCGKCSCLPISFWAETKFGKLRMKNLIEISKGSTKKTIWICDCGNETITPLVWVTCGNTSSCGKCSFLTAKYWEETKFGNLRMKNPKDCFPKSSEKVEWICDCEGETQATISNITNGRQKSCGKCNFITVSPEEKFGKIHIKETINTSRRSDNSVEWICECGVEFTAKIYNVLGSQKKSCGKCDVIEKTVVKELIIKERVVIEKPVKVPKIKTKKIVEKRADQTVSFIKFSELNIFKIKSDPCLHKQEICDFITSLDVEIKIDPSFDKYAFDIFIPKFNLLIDYHGLDPDKLKRSDFKKYQETVKNYDYVMFFEDEWSANRRKVENLLRNKFKLQIPESIRPQKCEIRRIQFFEADKFYDEFHYIGKCKAPHNFGVFYQNELIACISFKHPTRQSKYDFELIRMTSNPKYRVHGIWSKILKQFIEEYRPKYVVSFSDNRLFNGGVYKKIGFKLDGEIRPDYYWMRNAQRFHKSGLRKQKSEMDLGLTEYQLREAQGYKRVWDLGKKRWIIQTNF